MSELKIPDAAYVLGETTFRNTWGSPDEFIPAILDACAPLIVAAELRRFLTIDDYRPIWNRIQELDPQGLTEE